MRNRKVSVAVFVMAVCFAGLGGCASQLPPLRQDQTATISGRGIYYLHPSDFVSSIMSRAAEMTVDHGYRYFVILNAGGAAAYRSQSAIEPGQDITIKLYSADEISPGSRGVWDAQQILENGAPTAVARSSVSPTVRGTLPPYSPPLPPSPAYTPPPPASSPPQSTTNLPSWAHPKCTDSVCTW